ncbi:MAG: hypothetical protein JW915_23300 [Chitinispirillaceae bacterium]|nr:hypothetical protein [Chitinispirillaceae bacterium]
MKKIIMILFLAKMTFGQYVPFPYYDSISLPIMNAMKNARSKSALMTGNVLWPDSTIVNKNRIDPSKLKKDVIVNNIQLWLMRYILLPSFHNVDSLIFLTNMKNGDDWIIKREWYFGHYVQVVDAREITLLIKKIINIKDSTSFIKDLVSFLGDYINVYPRVLNINYIDQFQIEAYFCFKPEDKTLVRQRILLWTNGSFIVVNIPKVSYPYIDLMGLSVERTIGGISLENPKPFYRFHDSENYDLKEELYRIYPWIDDSINSWSKKDIGDGSEIIIGKHGYEFNSPFKGSKKK